MKICSNPKFRAGLTRKAIKKAGTVGLGAPAKSLTDERDAAKLMFEKQQ